MKVNVFSLFSSNTSFIVVKHYMMSTSFQFGPDLPDTSQEEKVYDHHQRVSVLGWV